MKAENFAPSASADTEYYPQEITIRISVSNNTTATTYSRLSSDSTSRGRLSDSPATGTSDTLILALELVLKNAARSPPFKVSFYQEQPPAVVKS